MCGLFGSLGNAVKSPNFYEAFEHLNHRGPDDTEVVHPNGEVTLAFHRLAIMDTSHAGDQPLKDVERKVWLICNGEVYNYPELYKHYQPTYPFTSHSDCEAILPLYREFGIRETARRLDAEYAFVIWDGEKNKLFAARDPIGIRPHFYGKSNLEGNIMFAS